MGIAPDDDRHRRSQGAEPNAEGGDRPEREGGPCCRHRSPERAREAREGVRAERAGQQDRREEGEVEAAHEAADARQRRGRQLGRIEVEHGPQPFDLPAGRGVSRFHLALAHERPERFAQRATPLGGLRPVPVQRSAFVAAHRELTVDGHCALGVASAREGCRLAKPLIRIGGPGTKATQSQLQANRWAPRATW